MKWGPEGTWGNGIQCNGVEQRFEEIVRRTLGFRGGIKSIFLGLRMEKWVKGLEVR